jgi:glutamyl-tRNA reductase
VQGEDAVPKLLADLLDAEHVAEALVLSTCNRLEIYAEVSKFHGGVQDVTDRLSWRTGVAIDDLAAHLYVHYEDRAVQHLLAVSSGLESVVVGEDQIIGQVRSALKLADDQGTLGRSLRDLGRLALRAGKRARAETGIDRLGLSLVSVGIERAVGSGDLSGVNVLVVGAGAMSGLAVATAARAGAAKVTVANRTRAKAERLASGIAGGVASAVADFNDLPAAIAAADLVISCTGAAGLVITEQDVRRALEKRSAAGNLVFLDLAMPRDVAHEVEDLPGVHVIDMDELSGTGGGVGADDVAAVRVIVEEEFAAYGSAVRAARVTPTVVALRAKAATVVDAELSRLAGRLTDEGVSGHALEEIAQTVRRVVDKLLHAPTVRVKELASSPDGEEYAAALRVLFDLDPRTVDAVTRAEVESPNLTQLEGSQ